MRVRSAVEQELAEFAYGLEWSQVPGPVREKVEDMLIDALANAIAGRSAEGTARVERALVSLDGRGLMTVVGSAQRLSLLGATAQNAYQVTAYTMCDVYRPALCHVTPEIVPVALAIAERQGSSGDEFLAAVTVGMEATVRLGRAINYAELRRRGFHSPGILGAMGAALAAGRLLGLSPEGCRGALGLAGSQASGTFAALGTDGVKFHQMLGARSGVTAAVLAHHGLRASMDVLSAPDGGVFSAYSNGACPEAVVADLGREWELQQISLRSHPGSSSVQAVGEAVELVAQDEGVSLSGVRSVSVTVPPSAWAMCEGVSWRDQLGALQSARYVAAAILARGAWWVELFDEATRADQSISQFARERVTVQASEEVPLGGAKVVVETNDGRSLEAYRPCALGDPAEPLSSSHIQAKLELACRSVPVAGDAAAISGAVRGLPGAVDLRLLLSQVRASPRRGTR